MSELCPVNHDAMRQLWDYNGDSLRELDDLTREMAQGLEAVVPDDITCIQSFEHSKDTLVQHGLPYGAPYTYLPPRLFDGLFETTHQATLPESEEEAKRLVDDYLSRAEQGVTQTGEYGHIPQKPLQSSYINLLPYFITRVAAQEVVDLQTWERYKEFGREQVQNGYYDLEQVSVRRAASDYSAKFFSPRKNFLDNTATGRSENYSLMGTSILGRDGEYLSDIIPVGYLTLPIGAYGAEFQERLLRGGTYLIDTIESELGHLSEQVGEQHSDILQAFTARGSRDEGRGDAEGLRRTMQEGIRTTMEAASILMAEKVPGYDNADDLFNAIVDQGIIEQFARKMPLGLTGPMALNGYFVPGMLQSNSQGKLSLSKESLDAMQRVKDEFRDSVLGGWIMYWSDLVSDERRKDMFAPMDFGLMCPAAFAHGAVETVCKLLARTVGKPETE